MHGNLPITPEVLLPFVSLFEGMGPEELAPIARSVQDIRLAKNRILFHKNDVCGGFHIVIHGQIKLFFTTADGTERVVEVLAQDQTFGEALMMAELPYMVSAQALADSLLLHVPRAAILEALDTSPRLRLKLLKLASGHLHQLMADGQAYSQKSGTQRFIAYLLRQLPGFSTSEKHAVATLPTSKGNISSLLNVTREHFSRILHSLSEQGLISVHGNRILIPDVARLASHLDATERFPPQGKGGACSRCATTAAGSCGRNIRCP